MKGILRLAPVALAVACGNDSPAPRAAAKDAAPPPPTAAAADAGDPRASRFPRVAVERAPGARPASADGELPRSAADLAENDRWLDVDVTDSLLCVDDPATRKQVVEALAAAPASDLPALLHHFAMPPRCAIRACGWIGAALPATQGAERELLATLGADCVGSRFDGWFAAPDAPDFAVLVRAAELRQPLPRLEALVRAAARAGGVQRRIALQAVGALDAPRALEILLELHAEARTDEARHEVASRLVGHRADRRAAKIVAAYCKRAPFDVACDPQTPAAAPEPTPTTDELARCVEALDEFDCWEGLLRRDRPRAVEIARRLLPDLPDDEFYRPMFAALVEFPDNASLESHLRRLGLLGEVPLDPDPTRVEPLDAMQDSGSASAISEAIQSPLDILRHDLAPLMADTIGPVYFDRPADDRLVAHAGGSLYTWTPGEPTPAVGALVGFANAVLEGEGSAERCLLITDGVADHVVCGPLGGLIEAIDTKLFGDGARVTP